MNNKLTNEEINEISRLTATVKGKGCCNCGTTEGNGIVNMILSSNWGGRVTESNLYFICAECDRAQREAEAERKELLSKAVSEGMARAKAQGKRLGRKRLTKDTLPHAFYGYYVDYLKGVISKTVFAEKIAVSRPTLDRYIRVYTGERN